MSFALKAKQCKTKYKRSLSCIPYLFTFANALFGFLSIIMALKSHYILSAYYIGLAALMDCCDGRIARALGSASYLGAELDGLCDAISFCCAPSILLYCFYEPTIQSIHFIILSIYLCAGLFRLAKFNTIVPKCSSYFSGLSTPVSAFFTASFIINYEWLHLYNLGWITTPHLFFTLVFVLSLLMISPLPFASFKNISFTNSSQIIVLLLFCSLILFCLINKLPLSLFVLTFYIFYSCLHGIYLIIKEFFIGLD